MKEAMDARDVSKESKQMGIKNRSRNVNNNKKEENCK